MDFDILGAINDQKVIAVGRAIRDLARLRRTYGPGRWRELKGRAMIRTFEVMCGKLRCTGMKLMESAGKNSRSKTSTRWPRFVMCVDNRGYPASLEVGKVYRQIKPRAN